MQASKRSSLQGLKKTKPALPLGNIKIRGRGLAAKKKRPFPEQRKELEGKEGKEESERKRNRSSPLQTTKKEKRKKILWTLLGFFGVAANQGGHEWVEPGTGGREKKQSKTYLVNSSLAGVVDRKEDRASSYQALKEGMVSTGKKRFRDNVNPIGGRCTLWE